MAEEIMSNFSELSGLFQEHEIRRPMIDFCLEQSKGRMFVDSVVNPTIALLVYRSQHVLAGNPANHRFLKEVLSGISRNIWGLMIPNANWLPILEQHWANGFETITRIELNSDSLDLDYLPSYKEVPDGYSIQKLTKNHIQNMHMDLLYDAIIDFEDFKSFEKHGLAFCVVEDANDNKVVSVASSVYPFTATLEIQVKTHPLYRRKGLALASCAALIEHCLQNGIKVYVDAAHDGSRDAALKLGFTDPIEWNAYRPK